MQENLAGELLLTALRGLSFGQTHLWWKGVKPGEDNLPVLTENPPVQMKLIPMCDPEWESVAIGVLQLLSSSTSVTIVALTELWMSMK